MIFQKIIGFLNRKKTQSITELPPGVKEGLEKHLRSDEEILFTLRDFRAIYKAPRWIDNNTFFNSWFILTSERVIVAKSSSSFKKFRDIPFNEIKKVDYETEVLESRLTIESPGTVDIIEFLREARGHLTGLKQTINGAIENTRRKEDADMMFCLKCESKIPRGSRFCPECGERLEVQRTLP